MTVRLFLDVDGVINAQGAMHKWPSTMVGRRQGFRIEWAPGMVDELRSLPVELWWTTTWRQFAVSDIGSLINYGNPAFVLHPEMSEKAETTFPSIDWKMRSVQKLYEREPFPFIHVDDELNEDGYRNPDIDQYREWVESVGGLIIGPHPFHGITPDHIAKMREYIEGLEG